MATVARLADHKPKHRRPPSSLPAPLFPGSDPMSEPIPDETFAEYFLAAGITPERMHGYGEHSLASAMTRCLRRSRPVLKAVPA